MLHSKKSQYIGKACYYSVNELMKWGMKDGRKNDKRNERKKQRKKKKLLINFTIIVSFYIWRGYLDTFLFLF